MARERSGRRGGHSTVGAGALLVAAFVVISAGVSTGARGEPGRPTATVELFIDPAAQRATGELRLVLTNVSAVSLESIPFWLYPNHLAKRSAGLNDVNFHWVYPRRFTGARADVTDAQVDGASTGVQLESTDAGADTLARVTLPRPLPPGGTTTVRLRFRTELPRRLGGFGCDGGSCRAMGGLYPLVAALSARGFELTAPPPSTALEITVKAPEGTPLLVNGVRGTSSVRATASVAAYGTLVAGGHRREDRVRAGQLEIAYLHQDLRPPPSTDQPLPYVREDHAGAILTQAARAAEAFLATAMPERRRAEVTARPLLILQAPIRHEMVQVHDDLVLVSDRLLHVFPAQRLRNFHLFELARAVMTALAARALRDVEPDHDHQLASEVLGATLTEAFVRRDFQKLEYARELLRPLSFIPAVDQLIYAPLVASAGSYFGDVEDRDAIRDDVRRGLVRSAGGRLIYSKLLDLLRPTGMRELALAMARDGLPLRRAAAAGFGADLGWFWAQWLGGRPRVNYRLVRVQELPGDGAARRVVIDLEREGDAIREPVEVRVVDRDGGVHERIWAAEAGTVRGQLVVDLPARLGSVEVDPRQRLVESAVGTLRWSDDPRYDNRQPRRWRLIYGGFGGLLDVRRLAASFTAAFLLKAQHDLRDSYRFLLRRSERISFGASAGYVWMFGRQANRNLLSSAIATGIGVDRLDPSFGALTPGAQTPGWRLSSTLGFEHDDRGFIIDPWRALGIDLNVGYILTALDNGVQLSQVSVGLQLVKLLELAPGQILAASFETSSTFGQIRLRSQLGGAGGPMGLRGYGADELLGRSRAIARLELRHRFVSDLDWNLLHFTAVRGFGGTLFADAAALSPCDGYRFSRDRVFFDAGYSLRMFHEVFGVYQQMLSIDVAVPLNRHATGDCFGPMDTRARAPFTVMISFLPTF